MSLLPSVADSMRCFVCFAAVERGAVSPGVGGGSQAAGRALASLIWLRTACPGRAARSLLLLEFRLKGFVKICTPYMNNSPFWCRSADPRTQKQITHDLG